MFRELEKEIWLSGIRRGAVRRWPYSIGNLSAWPWPLCSFDIDSYDEFRDYIINNGGIGVLPEYDM